MKYVFVCEHGQHRSSMAAGIAAKIAEDYQQSLETYYFGVNDNLPNSEKKKILEGADAVFIMEENMRFDIEKVLRYQGPVICLDIPDRPYDPLNLPGPEDYEEEEREVERKLREIWKSDKLRM